MIPVIIQARMSSHRLPGKVLKHLNGTPILGHVVHRCAQAVGAHNVVVATSQDSSDDPLSEFIKTTGVACHRGPLTDVYTRFVGALDLFSAQHFIRVCADSPFLDPGLIKIALDQTACYDVDLITNVFPRSYPKGQSVELVRRATFMDPKFRALSGFSAEHITQTFYQHPDHFDIVNFASPDGQNTPLSTWAIDTDQDFAEVQAWTTTHPEGPAPFGVGAITHHKKGRDHA